jgi:hypothetical protein
MINTAWDEYRGWAARGRDQQEAANRWNTAALMSAALAAIFGAAATQTAGHAVGQAFSLLAAIAAALTPLLGKEMLTLGSEAKWIRSRATAEAIKSECFRFAARSGRYGADDAEDQFIACRNSLVAEAAKAGVAQKPNPVGPEGDKRRPPSRFDLDWYLTNRIDDQITYYRKAQVKHEEWLKRLRFSMFAASAIAAVFGAIGLTNQQALAPWIGALTTVATALAAYGLLDRRAYLAASYAAMADGLGRLRDRATAMGLAAFVAQAEDLMQSEHAAWTERMTRTIAAPQTIDPQVRQ